MSRLTWWAFLLLGGIASCQAQEFIIATVAGGADPGFLPGTGDGLSAMSAGLANPCNDVALDASGNLYIAAGSLIRKVASDGTISTFAGGGDSVNDGVPATQAELAPTAIAVDTSGNLYIADSAFGISRVRKVDATGIITTIAGGYQCCSLGDGGPAIDAYLAIPYGLAVDAAGNIYIAQADENTSLVREVSTSGTITTVAGGGSCCAAGDGGPATRAYLSQPTGVAVDVAGNLYIADAGGNRIRKVTKGVISTVAGIDNPWHVAVDVSGNLCVTQVYDATVRMVTPAGTITTIAGNGTHGFSGDGGPATSAELDHPTGIALGSNGAIYVADDQPDAARVRLLTPSTLTGATPSITSGGVVSASAFGGFTSVAPGSWIEIYGKNMAANSRSWGGGDFNGSNAPTSLDGTTVTIGGQPAFIDYVSPTQVNVQVPSNVGTGSQQVMITTPAGTSAAYTITVNAVEPGLLAPASFQIGGKQYVAALFPDGVTFVLPTGAIAGVPSRPAQPGDTITFYGVGFGPVTPNIPAGQIVEKANTLASPLHIFFGQTAGTVSYDGLAPNVVGLYQFNVVVPNVATSNSVPLTFTLGSASGTQTLYIAVQD